MRDKCYRIIKRHARGKAKKNHLCWRVNKKKVSTLKIQKISFEFVCVLNIIRGSWVESCGLWRRGSIKKQFSFNLTNRKINWNFSPPLIFSSSPGGSLFRQNLTLNLNDAKVKTKKPFGTLDLHGLTDSGGNLSSRSSAGMSFNVGGFNRLNMALIDDTIPLERQG